MADPERAEPFPQLMRLLQAHESASTEEEIQAWQEDRKISKYAENLSQLPSTKRIPMDPKQVFTICSTSSFRSRRVCVQDTITKVHGGLPYPKTFDLFARPQNL